MKIAPDILNEARRLARKTQGELADEIGVSLRTVTNWESPRGYGPPEKYSSALTAALGEALDQAEMVIRLRNGTLTPPDTPVPEADPDEAAQHNAETAAMREAYSKPVPDRDEYERRNEWKLARRVLSAFSSEELTRELYERSSGRR